MKWLGYDDVKTDLYIRREPSHYLKAVVPERAKAQVHAALERERACQLAGNEAGAEMWLRVMYAFKRAARALGVK